MKLASSDGLSLRKDVSLMLDLDNIEKKIGWNKMKAKQNEWIIRIGNRFIIHLFSQKILFFTKYKKIDQF